LARAHLAAKDRIKGIIGLSNKSFIVVGPSARKIAAACLLFGICRYPANAQQAPLPPGTTAPDTPPKSAPESAPTPLADAEGDIALQNYDKARNLLLPWLSAHPNDAQALFDLGYLEDAENHPNAAAADYKKSIDADPKRFESRLSLGLLLAHQGHTPEAIEQLTTAVTLKPDPPNIAAQAQAYRALARLERTTDPAAAKEHLLDALHIGPEQPDDLLLTAEIATANEDDETAEAAYREVLARQPESSDATAGLVHLLLKQKKYTEAEPLLRAAVARDPDNPALNSQLASTLTYEGKNDQALVILEKLHTLRQDDPIIGGMLADAYTQNGTPEKGEPILIDLLKKYPQDADLLNARGENLLQLHRYPEAITALQAAVKVSPENADDWMGLAIAASQNKQYPLVLEALSMRAKFSDENAGSNFLRATAYDNLHQKSQAVEYYKKFLAASAGKFPDQEWEAQHRLIALGKSN
jgi:tetratricopeptide (TPR) repeat protein